ncbi:MAG: hypothetical protein ACR2I2_22415 [Bryobacteraceae bacterium]
MSTPPVGSRFRDPAIGTVASRTGDLRNPNVAYVSAIGPGLQSPGAPPSIAWCYCAAILRRALARCRAEGIHALENVGCDLENTRVFDEFAPYRRKLPGWSSFYLSRRPELAESLRNPAAWAPSSYDGDSSL